MARMLWPGGMIPLLRVASPAVTSRQTAVMAGWPGCAMLNSWPAGLSVRKSAKPWLATRLSSNPRSSVVAADGEDSTPTDRDSVL